MTYACDDGFAERVDAVDVFGPGGGEGGGKGLVGVGRGQQMGIFTVTRQP